MEGRRGSSLCPCSECWTLGACKQSGHAGGVIICQRYSCHRRSLCSELFEMVKDLIFAEIILLVRLLHLPNWLNTYSFRRSIMCNGGEGADPVDLETSFASSMTAEHYFLEKGEPIEQSVGVNGERDGIGDKDEVYSTTTKFKLPSLANQPNTIVELEDQRS